MVRALLVLVLSFAFLSSDAALLLGLETARMALFAGAMLALTAATLAATSGLDGRRKTVPVLLTLLLAAIALADLGHGLDLVDYKILLLVLALLLAPNLASALAGADLARLVWRLLALYVAATGAAALVGLPLLVQRGHDVFARVDFAGSLVSHAGLCTVFVLASGARLAAARSPWSGALGLGLVLAALLMTFLTATRSVLVTIALFAALSVLTAQSPLRQLGRLVPASGAAGLAFTLCTWLVSDAFLQRLIGPRIADYSSGRASSQAWWLARAAEHPLGLGLGAVRQHLANGRPALDGTRLLEWPHNEPVRFFIEAGPLGLAFVLLLTGWLVRWTARAARADRDAPRRALALAILADLLTQTLFQNYLNMVYYAVPLVLVLTVLLVQAEDAASTNEPEPSPAAGANEVRG